MSTLGIAPLTTFEPPGDLTAPAPAEARGVRRDDVRLLVADDDNVHHARFRDLVEHLHPGDLVVVNASRTEPRQVDAHLGLGRRGRPVVLHVATDLRDGTWVVELRTAPHAERAVLDARAGQVVPLEGFGAGAMTLLAPHAVAAASPTGRGNRLWRAAYDGPSTLRAVLEERGRPIAYGYLDRRYPLEDYQTVFGTTPGSAEMPSAARPFTPELVTRLVASGVAVAPVLLHTGVSSQEAGEPPQPEWFEVGAATAQLVNVTRARGGRVVAVGTTVTRALESAAVSGRSLVQPSRGWTERLVTRDDPPRVVDGLVSGWHDPQASHILLVEAISGPALAQLAYDGAVREHYRWHEFGDTALFLPSRAATAAA